MAHVSWKLGWSPVSQIGFLLVCVSPRRPDLYTIWPMGLSGETPENKTRFSFAFSEETQV